MHFPIFKPLSPWVQLGIAAVILVGGSPSFAMYGYLPNGSLDKVAISHDYFEGDFQRVLPPLENYRANFPKSATRDDSVFVFKYLSVIYAANPSTKAKGESYMVALIRLMPAIELLDLYVSDNIQAIFKNVKADYFAQQEYIKEHDEFGHRKLPKNSNSENSKSKTIWWVAGGVGVAAAVATTAYFVFEPKPNAQKNVVPVFQGGAPK
jgi:hypothetical protein